MLEAAPETMAKKISQTARTLISSDAGGGDGNTFSVNECVGSFMIFCGGLVMAIDDQMPLAVEQLANIVGQKNTMGVCCFGEQGMDCDHKATHGNLMFGCLLFSNKPRVPIKAVKIDEAKLEKILQIQQSAAEQLSGAVGKLGLMSSKASSPIGKRLLRAASSLKVAADPTPPASPPSAETKEDTKSAYPVSDDVELTPVETIAA